MKNVEKLTEKELQEIAAAGINIPELVQKYGPAILEKLGDLIGLGKKDSGSSSGGTTAQPQNVSNGPSFNNNNNSGNFYNNTTATNFVANNNGNVNGSQNFTCGGAK